jgi:hypothetical protein
MPIAIINGQAGLDWLAVTYFTPKSEPSKQASPLPPSASATDGRQLTDDKIIHFLSHTPKSAALWCGDTSAHAGDDSAADLALCAYIAFYAGQGGEGQTDRVFRLSGLMRPKWDAKHRADGTTYGQMTVAKAFFGKTEFYTPRPKVTWTQSGGVNPSLIKTPIIIPEFQPFPIEALPPVVREFVVAVGKSVNCDPAFAALPALTLAGVCIGGAAVISPKRGYRQPPILWTCCVGDSGTGKTPAADPIRAVAFDIKSKLKIEYAQGMADYESELEIWKEDKGEGKQVGPKPKKPVRDYFVVEDTTIERLAEIVEGSPRGIVVFKDELAGWFDSFRKYKGKNGDSDVSNWLSIYEAGPISNHRKTGERRDIEVDRAVVCVHGGIQPSILKSHLDDPSYVASGLAARLLFTWPPKSCPRWSDVEVDPDTEKRFADLMAELRELLFYPKKGPKEIRLDPAARSEFIRFNDGCMATAEDLDGGPMSAVLPKAVRIALRIALIHHCVRHVVAGIDPMEQMIELESMNTGIVLAKWFIREADRVYLMLAEQPADRQERVLVNLIRRKGGRMTPRDLMRSNSQAYPTTDVTEVALNALVTNGWGSWEQTGPGPKGGRSSTTFVLDPKHMPDARHNPTEPEVNVDID